jgi:hypothetical protein
MLLRELQRASSIITFTVKTSGNLLCVWVQILATKATLLAISYASLALMFIYYASVSAKPVVFHILSAEF